MAISQQSGAADLWGRVFLPGIVCSAALLAAYLATMDWQFSFPRDFQSFAIGRDFLNFWTYGREAWSGEAGRFYDIVLYNQHLRELTGWAYEPQQWSYPPHLMLLMAPFGLLPYIPAYILWLGLGLAALIWAAPASGERGRGAMAMFLAPAGLACLLSGQNSFFVAAIFVAIFRFMDARPLVAGILLGALTVKPQLGLLFPLMLILTGRWMVFAAAAATALALAGVTALLFGTEVWEDYLTVGIPLQEYVIADPTRATMGMMPTAYMNARIAGLSADLAYALQAIFAAAAAVAVIVTYRRSGDPLLSFGVLVLATLSATPYLMSYDLVIVAWLLLAIYGTGAVAGPERLLLLAVYFLPFLSIAGELAGLPGSALALPALAIVLLRRLGAELQARPAAGAPNNSGGLSTVN